MLHSNTERVVVGDKKKYKYKLNIGYEKFDILDIENNFKKSDSFLHNERNKIKKIDNFVVKSFKIPNIFNKIIYTFFKDSKAQKSYQNSLKCGIYAPKPVGFIEYNKLNLLTKSFYVSENFNFDWTIREFLLNNRNSKRKTVFKEFAKFCYKLHQKNIFHLDFSPGNILIKQIGKKFEFKIVDVNRMKFEKMDKKKRALSFAKLWAENEDLEIIIKEYQKLYQNEGLLELALEESQKHKNRVNFKKMIKRKLRRGK